MAACLSYISYKVKHVRSAFVPAPVHLESYEGNPLGEVTLIRQDEPRLQGFLHNPYRDASRGQLVASDSTMPRKYKVGHFPFYTLSGQHQDRVLGSGWQ